MLDWDKLRIFYAVAKAGSFTHAAETLGLNQSSISRQVSALEDSLRVALFHRHARGLLLTEQGELLLKTVSGVYGQLGQVEDAIRETKERPNGPLRINTPVAFGTMWLAPRIREFAELYPEIAVTLLMDDRPYDLSMREADVAIRPRDTVQPDLISKPLLTFRNAIYASHSYLDTHGTPDTQDELADHPMLAFYEGGDVPHHQMNWLLDVGVPKGQKRHKPALVVNNLIAMLMAMESGFGIASVPDYMVQDNQNVRRILPDVPCPHYDVCYVYPPELRNAKRISVFYDFLQQKTAHLPRTRQNG